MYGAMRKRILTKSVISLLFVPMSAAIHAFAWKGLALQLSRIRGGGGGPSSSSYSDVEDNGEPFHEDDVNDEKISYPQHFEEEEEDVVVDAAAVLAMEREDPIASEFVDEITPKRRRTSDIILNLIDKTIGSDEGGENMNHNQKAFLDDLRLLIMERRDGLIQDLNENTQAKEDSQQHHDDPIDGMKRLLHFLAPKIPAIRHSPDVSLAIRSLPSDGDAGLAASLVATLAHLWEIQQLQSTRQQQDRFSGSSSDNATALVAAELVHDRRFEQLLETITCGVHVNKRKKESQALHMPQHGDSSTDNEDDLIQLILQHSEIPDGLSIRDSCRAAWGIAMLGLHDVKVVGEINVPDLILALSLRTRDLVLGHVRLLCQDDFYVESSNTTGTVSVEERIMEIAQEIAEDTATAMWVFGCVQAVTGIKCAPLFHVCSSVLCQDPFQLRNNVQEAIATHEEQPVVGGNDIIDKLDRAERTEHSQSSSLSPNRHRQGKDIFLDWLSPTEVTDVLWALAVYASKDAASTDSMTILSDVAVDRVLEWVAQELQHRGTPVEKGFNSEVRGSEQTKTVELDPQQTPTGLPKRDTENSVDGVERNFANDTSKVDDVTKDFDYVEVVDAAAILAQEQDQVEDISLEDDPMIENLQREDVYSAPVDSEFLMDEIAEVFDPTLLVKREEGLAHDSALNNEQRTDPVTTYLSEKNTIDWLFSAHDLCSLSWAATELGDSLKSRTTQMVSDLLVLMGRGHLAGCSSADYSNLIWAVAKESNEKASPSTPNFITLGRWIAENVYSASGLKDAVIESDSWSLLRHFQPPELSRLLWSLASLSITAEDSHLSSLVGVLSLAGLETASRNSHVFSIEDLARIFWAFVEYSDYDAVLQTNPSSLVSLGRVLGLIDISLSSWEAGDVHPGPKLDEEESKTENEHAKEAFRFTSFFGRARFHITKFERKGEDMQDDLDDYPVPSLLAEKTRLPLLKDFPVDPATLCKLCGSLNRSGTKYSMVCDTHTMAKVILRLMTSRNGRLLRECHVSDLVSLCVTAVSVTSSANREIVGLFSRRAVKLLNEHPSLLDSATPAILIKLIGALGDLGVKYHPEIDSRNAYRRLQLTVRFPFSDDFAYESLSDESLKILARGLAIMNATWSEESITSRTLEELDRRFPVLKDEETRLDDLLCTMMHFQPSVTSSYHNSSHANQTEEMNELHDDESKAIGKIAKWTASLLHQIAQSSVEKIRFVESSELRKILHHFVSLPFPVDDLVDAAEEEVSRRLAGLDGHNTANTRFIEALKRVPPGMMKNFVGNEKGQPSKAIKKMLRNFSKEKKENHETIVETPELARGTNDRPTSFEDMVEILVAAVEVRDNEVDFPINDKTDRVEYGRIRELIAQYRRIDFASGARQSRFNQEGQRLMAKRMMSRLLP